MPFVKFHWEYIDYSPFFLGLHRQEYSRRFRYMCVCYTYMSMEAQGQCQASSVSQCIEAGFLANLKLPSSTGPYSQPALSSPVSLALVQEWEAGTCVHSSFPCVWGILNVIMLSVKLFIPWATLSSMRFFCTSSNMNERVAFVDTGIGVSQPC